MRFRQFLCDMEMALPATFLGDAAASWVGPTQREHRIDFVCVPLPWLTGFTGAKRLPAEFAIGEKRDHSAMAVSVAWRSREPNVAVKRSAPRALLNVPEVASNIAAAWEGVPDLP